MSTVTNVNLLNLDYNQEQFKQNYKGFIAPFNHGPMAKGPVDIEKVQLIAKELIEKAQVETTSVSFDPSPERLQMELVEGEKGRKELTGGSCTAIALQVAQAALKQLKTSANKEDLVNHLKATVSQIGKTSSNRQTIRNVQAAYNTIFVKKEVEVADISQHKIKALAAHHDIKVISSTEELKVDDKEQACQAKFEETIRTLNEGVYLVRVLVKQDNVKMEKQGHSTVYIKLADGQSLYFDTQLGLYDLVQADQKAHLIYQASCSAKKKFEIDSCKFHQLSL